MLFWLLRHLFWSKHFYFGNWSSLSTLKLFTSFKLLPLFVRNYLEFMSWLPRILALKVAFVRTFFRCFFAIICLQDYYRPDLCLYFGLPCQTSQNLLHSVYWILLHRAYYTFHALDSFHWSTLFQLRATKPAIFGSGYIPVDIYATLLWICYERIMVILLSCVLPQAPELSRYYFCVRFT